MPAAPRPNRCSGDRVAWLEVEKARATEHLTKCLSVARTSPVTRDRLPKTHSLWSDLDHLIAAAADAEYYYNLERNMLLLLRDLRSAVCRLHTALDGLPVANTKVTDRPAPVADTELGFIVLSEIGDPLSPTGQFLRRGLLYTSYIAPLREERALIDALHEVERVAAEFVSKRSVVGSDDSFAARPREGVKGRSPTSECFARHCLRFGLGPDEAAMVEAIVFTSPERVTLSPKYWFDYTDRARVRWQAVFASLLKKIA